MIDARTGFAALLIALPAAASAAGAPGASVSPPAGTVLIARYAAAGSQTYTCTSRDGALAWDAPVPEADLTGQDGTSVAHHAGGPVWEARDGARVVGTILAKEPAPETGALPWVLLSATTTGTGTLAGTRYVVRQDTVGGVPPVASCASAGLTLRVPYRAIYAFYR